MGLVCTEGQGNRTRGSTWTELARKGSASIGNETEACDAIYSRSDAKTTFTRFRQRQGRVHM